MLGLDDHVAVLLLGLVAHYPAECGREGVYVVPEGGVALDDRALAFAALDGVGFVDQSAGQGVHMQTEAGYRAGHELPVAVVDIAAHGRNGHDALVLHLFGQFPVTTVAGLDQDDAIPRK